MNAEQFLGRVETWAESRPDVHGALLVGSQARADRVADEWSDVDLALLVDDPDRYLADERWLDAFGPWLLTFVEPTAVGHAFERRVLFRDGLDVDISFFTLASLQGAFEDPQVAGVLRRGHRVLFDDAEIADLAARATRSVAPSPRAPDAASFRELGADFWYHALWAAKKLARGELLMATRSVNGYLKERLIVLFGWHARAGDPQLDTWHEGRFFETWADGRAVDALRGSYARYDRGEVAKALLATMDAFAQFERETAARLGLDEPPSRDPVCALVVSAVTE